MKITNDLKEFLEPWDHIELNFSNGVSFVLYYDEDENLEDATVDLEFGTSMNGDLENIYQEGMLYAKKCEALSALMDKLEPIDHGHDGDRGIEGDQWVMVEFSLKGLLELIGKELKE